MEHPSAALVPAGTAAELRGLKLTLDPARIDEIERTVKHDVIAFLTHVEEVAARTGPEGPRPPAGCTSA
jgi:adenylosuccinate lyase